MMEFNDEIFDNLPNFNLDFLDTEDTEIYLIKHISSESIQAYIRLLGQYDKTKI